ncbi:hypothetical protein E8E12_003290 [Didymella heteroderae]|uniref:Uncharacterized protein n=1 Tax=Didymella heteroderae TaxID=1769908 RepID=A0A9P5C2G2_9PLEO|nr:hypothetical protein E8E12_003290 [Didymella heteroderae]
MAKHSAMLFFFVIATLARYERVEKYTTRWFMDNVLHKVQADYKDTNGLFHNALFYTRNMSATAIRYACAQHRITIWQPWHPSLYNSSNAPTNRFSCIHHNATARNYFFANMSEAFAKLSSDNALVMHSVADYAHPPTDGIWATVEKSAISKRLTAVKQVYKIQAMDAESIMAIWTSDLGDVVGKTAEDVTARFKAYFPLRGRSVTRRGAPQQVLEDAAFAERLSLRCPVVPEYTLPVDW